MKIHELGLDQQWGLRGHCISVPIDLNDTVGIVTSLPRLVSEDGTVLVQVMRRMNDKSPYQYEIIRTGVVKTAELLKKTDLYKLHNITLRPNWEHDF